MRIDDVRLQQPVQVKTGTTGVSTGDVVDGRVLSTENGVMLMRMTNGQALRAQLPEKTDIAAGTLLTLRIGEQSGDQLQARIVAVDGRPVSSEPGAQSNLSASVLKGGSGDAMIRDLLKALGADAAPETVDAAAGLMRSQPGTDAQQAAFLVKNGMASEMEMASLLNRLVDGTFRVSETWSGISQAVSSLTAGANAATLATLVAPLEERAVLAQAAAGLSAQLDDMNGASSADASAAQSGRSSATSALGALKNVEVLLALEKAIAQAIGGKPDAASAGTVGGMAGGTTAGMAVGTAAGMAGALDLELAATQMPAAFAPAAALDAGNSPGLAGAPADESAKNAAALLDGTAGRMADALLRDPSFRSVLRQWNINPADPQAREQLAARLDGLAIAAGAGAAAGSGVTASSVAGASGGDAGSIGLAGQTGRALTEFLAAVSGDMRAAVADLQGRDPELLARQIGRALEKPFLEVQAGTNPTVEELHLPKAVHEMQQRLEWAREVMRHADADTAQLMQPLVQDAETALRFFNQVTSYNTFVQIPIRMNQQETQGELYVMQRRGRRGRIDPGDFTLFLSLDTENLGRIESLAHARNRCVTLNLHVDSEPVQELAREMQESLHAGLREKNFKLVDLKIRLSSEEPLNILTAAKQSGKIIGLDAGFDIRL